MGMWRSWWVLMALVAGVVGCDTAPVLATGQPPPSFVLKTLEGGELNFPGDLAGKAVVIRFWADWCPFCRNEMRDAEGVFQAHQGAGLTILAVNAGQERETVERFIASLGPIGYTTLLDPDSATARRYGVVGLPTTFLVGRDGLLKGKLLGETDRATFERAVARLLEPPP